MSVEHGSTFFRSSFDGFTQCLKFVQISNALNLFNGIGKTIKATQGGKTSPHLDIPRYVKLYQNDRLQIDHLFTHRVPLVDVNKGFDLLRSGNAGRVIVSIHEK